MNAAAVVGYIAAAVSVTGFVPQAWRIVKTRDTKSLSTKMWVGECLAFALWTVYGVMLGELPIIIPNTLCFILSAFILTMKLVPRHTRDKIADTIDPAVSTSGT